MANSRKYDEKIWAEYDRARRAKGARMLLTNQDVTRFNAAGVRAQNNQSVPSGQDLQGAPGPFATGAEQQSNEDLAARVEDAMNRFNFVGDDLLDGNSDTWSDDDITRITNDPRFKELNLTELEAERLIPLIREQQQRDATPLWGKALNYAMAGFAGVTEATYILPTLGIQASNTDTFGDLEESWKKIRPSGLLKDGQISPWDQDIPLVDKVNATLESDQTVTAAQAGQAAVVSHIIEGAKRDDGTLPDRDEDGNLLFPEDYPRDANGIPITDVTDPKLQEYFRSEGSPTGPIDGFLSLVVPVGAVTKPITKGLGWLRGTSIFKGNAIKTSMDGLEDALMAATKHADEVAGDAKPFVKPTGETPDIKPTSDAGKTADDISRGVDDVFDPEFVKTRDAENATRAADEAAPMRTEEAQAAWDDAFGAHLRENADAPSRWFFKMKDADLATRERMLRDMGMGDRADVAGAFEHIGKNDLEMGLVLMDVMSGSKASYNVLRDTNPALLLRLTNDADASVLLRSLAKEHGVDLRPTMTGQEVIDQLARRDPQMFEDVMKGWEAGDEGLARVREVAFTGVSANRGPSPIKFLEERRWKAAEKKAHRELGITKGRGEPGVGDVPLTYTRQLGKSGFYYNLVAFAKNQRPSFTVGTKGAGREGSTQEVKAYIGSVKGLSNEQRANIFNKWAMSSFDETKMAKATMEMEQEVTSIVINRHADRLFGEELSKVKPGSPKHARLLEQRAQWVEDKTAFGQAIKNKRDRVTNDFVENGNRYTEVKSDGTVHVTEAAFTEADIANSIRLLDVGLLEKQLGRTSRDSRYVEHVGRHGQVESQLTEADANLFSKVGNEIYKVNSNIMSAWKPSVILRLAYIPRNAIDNLGRAFSFMGTSVFTGQGLKAMGRTTANAARRVTGNQKRSIRKWQKRYDQAVQSNEEFFKLDVQTQRTRDNLAYVNEKLKTATDPVEVNQLKTYNVALESILGDAEAQLKVLRGTDSYSDMLVAGKKLEARAPSQRSAMGRMGVATAGGDTLDLGEAFYGKRGRANRKNISSAKTVQRTMSGNYDVENRLLHDQVKWLNREIQPASQQYAPELADMVNTKLRGTFIGRERLADQPFEVVYAKMKDPANSDIRIVLRDLMDLDLDDAYAVRTWWENGQATLKAWLPDDEVRSLAYSRDLTAADVRRMSDRDDLIPIVGDDVLGVLPEDKNLIAHAKTMRDKLMHTLSTIPEDAQRGLYFTGSYNKYANKMAQRVSEPLSEADALATGLKIEQEASRAATRRVKGDLYTVERRSSLMNLMESVMPFIEAQWNTTKAWGRILSRDPASMPLYAGRMWNWAQKTGVADEEGNINVPGTNYEVNINNVLSIITNGTPMALTNLLSERDLEFFGVFSFMLPQLGPQFSVVFSEAVKNRWFGLTEETPILGTIAKWQNPLGPSEEGGSWDALLPSWVNLAQAYLRTEDSAKFEATKDMITHQEWVKYESGIRSDFPSPDEILNKTRDALLWQAVGSFILPGMPRLKDPLKPIADFNRELTGRIGDPLRSQEIMLAMFGDEFSSLTTRGTVNRGGIPQTAKGVDVLRKNPELFAKIASIYGTDDPAMVSLLFNPDDEYEFSPGARKILLTTGIPGRTGQTWLQHRTADEWVTKQRESEGWASYNLLYKTDMDALERQHIKKYGSIDKMPQKERIAYFNQRKRVRKDAVALIAKENPEWKIAYEESVNPTKIHKAVESIRAITKDKKFAKQTAGDPFFETLRTFIKTRDSFVRRESKNDYVKRNSVFQSKNPTVGEKEKAEYEEKIRKLRKSNTRFDSLYERFFSGEEYMDWLGGR